MRFFFRSIQPTEINCVPKYTVARRFGRGRPTVWYFCEKSNGISVITFNWRICINVGAPRQRYKLRARKKSDFVQKAGHFHDLAGRGTSGQKRDCPAKSGTVGRSAEMIRFRRLCQTGSCTTGWCQYSEENCWCAATTDDSNVICDDDLQGYVCVW